MSFERSDILKPILDDLAANDQILFHATQQRILGQFSARGTAMSSMAANAIAEAFKEELSKRRDDLLSEMKRVLEQALVEDFERLKEELSVELSSRLETCGDLARSEFQKGTEMIRSSIGNAGLLITAIPEHLKQIKTKLKLWFQEPMRGDGQIVFPNARALRTAVMGRPVKKPIGAGHETIRRLTMRAIEREQHGIGSRCCQPINHAGVVAAAVIRGSIETVIGAYDETVVGPCTRGIATCVNDGKIRPICGDVKDGAFSICAILLVSSVE
jgi:hypothetical protein